MKRKNYSVEKIVKEPLKVPSEGSFFNSAASSTQFRQQPVGTILEAAEIFTSNS